MSADGGLLRSGALMAAGTVASRLTGFARSAVIVAALGIWVSADIFNLANTVPNALYILVAGGVLNSVLVPQLVRAIKNDADGGVAYAQRVFTAVVIVLFVASVLFTLLAPWILRLYLTDEWTQPALHQQFEAMVLFARFCFPQVFFYGLYVIVGQMLNARGSFGPMMWSPVVNNLVAIAVFGSYLVVWGTKERGDTTFSTGEIAWLGIGSTLGIVLQAVVLLPVLRASGLRLRLRTDLRGVGLSKVGKLGVWTILFVLVNQITFLIVTNLASGATAADAVHGAGITVYANGNLLVMVPHGIITVSLATALLPTLSRTVAEGRTTDVADQLRRALRTCLAIIAPVAVLIAVLRTPLTASLFGWGAARDNTGGIALTVLLFLPGLVAFTTHYLVLRGFYAYEDTRTPFYIQIVLAIVNVVAAVLIAARASPPDVAPALAAAYSIAYVVGATISLTVLRRQRVPGLQLGVARLFGQVALAAVPSVLATLLTRWLVAAVLPDGRLQSMVIVVLAGLVGAAVFALMAVVVGLHEVTEILDLALGRFGRTGRSGRYSRGSGPARAVPPSMGQQSGSSGAMAYQAGEGLDATALEMYGLIEEVGDARTPPGWRQYGKAGGRRTAEVPRPAEPAAPDSEARSPEPEDSQRRTPHP